MFFGRNDAKAEAPVLWPPHVKSWLIWKDLHAGRDWGQEEKGTTEDEIAGWHHWLDGRESGWAPGVGNGQGGLACCDSWGRKGSDTTEQLNWTDSCVEIAFFNQTLHMEITRWSIPSQIDFILCTKRWRSSIQSAKTRPGADCGSDHELLIAKCRLNWRK